jgi:hypothetical protein
VAVTRTTRHRHRLRMIPRSRWLLLGIAFGVVLFLAGSVVWAQLGEQEAIDQTDATAARAKEAADPVLALCAQNDDVARALYERGACDLAEQVAQTPVPEQPPLPGPTGGQGRPPTPAEIQAAVAAELAANPPPAGRPPTTAEITAVVASVLAANPPSPGRPPTAAEIEAVVAAWFAANPTPPGEDGEDGRDGRTPTPAEIQAAVAAELAANPPAAGPKGDPGVDGARGPEGDPGPTCPPGTSLEAVTFAGGETGLGCVDQFVEPPPGEDEGGLLDPP